MDEKAVLDRLEDLDNELTGTHAIACNSYWPATAVACALLDKGVIDKANLLKIVDTLMATASAFSVTEEIDASYSAHSLEIFRLQLEQLNLRPGHVLEELERVERGAALQADQYHQMLKRERRDNPGGAETT